MIDKDVTRRAALAGAGAGLLGAPALANPSGIAQPTVRRRVSVLDHIPPELHKMIAAGTCRTDLSAYFQAATVAVNGGQIRGDGPGGVVFVPAGIYPVTHVGIRDTVILGEHRTSSRIVATPGAGANRFLLDAKTDRDGITANTNGGSGSASHLTIDAGETGASGLRTYGGGCIVQDLSVYNAVVGVAAGLPMWSTFSNIHTTNCDTGIRVFAELAGHAGTSTTFSNCWANRSRRYGIHVTQLMYSSFVNCAAQDSGEINFLVEGDFNQAVAAYSLQFIGCGTEGGGRPFHFRRCRDLSLIGARVVDPPAGADLVTLEDSDGSIRDFSTVSPPRPPALTVKLVNHGAPPGGVLIDNSIVAIDPKFRQSFTQIGGELNGVAGIQGAALSIAAHTGAITAQIEGKGRATTLALRSQAERLAAFSLSGGTILSAGNPQDLLALLGQDEIAVALTADRKTLEFLFKDANGRTFAVTLPGRPIG